VCDLLKGNSYTSALSLRQSSIPTREVLLTVRVSLSHFSQSPIINFSLIYRSFLLFSLFLSRPRAPIAKFLDGFYPRESRASSSSSILAFPGSPFLARVSYFPPFFFLVAAPSNISQLRSFMGHHKDTRCVSVAWWPTRVNFYYGCKRVESQELSLVDGRVFS